LYIDLNSFFASCEQQEHPHLRGKPVAVVPMLADTTFCIAASYEAKAFGVKTGTRVGDAKKMCPGLKLVEASHHTYIQYHHRMIKAVDSCVPVHSVCSIDEIACELTGSQQDVEVARTLAKKIKVALNQHVGQFIKGSIGLGPNMLLAKVASDMQKPDGLTSIAKEELPARLYSLKPQDIPGIGRRMESRLYARGITSIEKLLNCNESEMRGLWGGVPGARLYHILRGEDLSTPAYFHRANVPKSIGHEHVLPPRERNIFDSLVVAQRLLNKAAVRLRKAQMMARYMAISIRAQDGSWAEKSVGFHETQDTSFLLQELNRLHQFLRVQRPLKIGVVLGDFIPEQEHQLSLFQDERRNKIFHVVDAINQKYGRDTVYVGSMHEHRQSAPTRIAFSRIPGLDEVDE
jgi:DNA polymerase-4